MRSFQGGRPSIYTLTDAIKKIPTPMLAGSQAYLKLASEVIQREGRWRAA